jgi:hypothetical protein
LGAGPDVNFDFSTFRVQVPTIGSAANAELAANNEPRSNNVRSFLMTDDSPDVFVYVWYYFNAAS